MEQSVIDKLDAEFDAKRAKTKEVKGRPDAKYLESYDVINTANRIFGYGAWGTKIIDLELHETGGKTACVVTLELSVDGCFSRQDVGVVIAAQKAGEPMTPGALETAIKGAASDGLKRCFRQLGKQFGNDLYAKGPVAKEPTKAARAQKPKEGEEKPKAKPCPLHPNEELLFHRNEATGAEWYSHKDGDNWCRGE